MAAHDKKFTTPVLDKIGVTSPFGRCKRLTDDHPFGSSYPQRIGTPHRTSRPIINKE